MPLVRVEVRNEYGLGLPDLYKEANKEDPKALLDGVAVAGLVGILRQLGDLAEFAAEVFHGLQEQVMNTSSRSHTLMARVQNIEAALPPLEKAVLAQKSHLHFAYTAGSHWHTRVKSEQNHFIFSDLPRFIMDSYEECRDPPRLHLLDKFDSGGPGSCLKRYSDPTFFRRASAGSDVTYAAKVLRDKKARKSKKKRMRLRNGELPYGLSHGIPISSHGVRMQYASQNFDGQTSPSQTVSTFDVALKSELGEQSNSFDSRAGSGYIECSFSPSYTMQSDGRHPKEMPSPQLNIHHDDALDTSSLEEQGGVVDDVIQEQTGQRSSCVTWDEKTEIMEPPEQQYYHNDLTEIIPTNFDQDTPEVEAVNLRTEDEIDFHFDNEIMPASVSGRNQLDDIESETDYYMDALNTIESESETDLDCQTKREVEQFSTLNRKAVEEGKPCITAQQSEGHSSNLESHIPAYISSNKAISEEKYNSVSPKSPNAVHSFPNQETSILKSNSVSSECYSHLQSPEESGKSSMVDTLPGHDACESADILDGSNAETVVSNVFSRETILQAPKTDKILVSSRESRESPFLPPGVQSINFWTNGGLLGLEPSKPPDFAQLNAVNHDSSDKSKDGIAFQSSRSNISKGDGHAIKSDIEVNSSKMTEQDAQCSISSHNNQDDISTEKTSQRSSAQLDVKLEKSTDFEHGTSSNGHMLGYSETSRKIPETEGSFTYVQATKTCKDDCKKSSRMFEFSNRLLVNGFRRQVSLVGDDNSVKNGVSAENSLYQAYQTFSGRTFKEQFGSGSPSMSSPSSPPLEHMKISFQPIDCFETSKLKLKFPDGSDCQGNSGNMFPSFQLVPEPSILLQDLGSDSDDDTFCRSSHMSDDCLSHCSESNSEQWDTRDSPRSKDDEIYDALRRVSSVDSVSSNLDIGRTAEESVLDKFGLQSPFSGNIVEHYQSDRLLDLPSFETLNHPSFRQEFHKDSEAKYNLESHIAEEPTPAPPPLPPVQWRAVKPDPDVTVEKQDALSEALKYAFELKLSASTISQQPKPAPVKHDQITEAITYTSKGKVLMPDIEKLNGPKEGDQPSISNELDEKDDFLQQIRTKSFSLRRTTPVRPTFTTVSPANVKVTAILEKANAIRQAVGSDDGEDGDNWSDT